MSCFEWAQAMRYAALRSTPFFIVAAQHPSGDLLLALIAKHSILVTVARGQRMVVPEDGNLLTRCFAVVVSGSLARSTPAGSESRPLKRGDFWCAITGDTSVTAKRKARVLLVTHRAIAKAHAAIMADDPIMADDSAAEGTRGMMDAVVTMDINEVMAAVPYFATLDHSHRTSLSALFAFEPYLQDAVIYSAGAPADRFFVLISGRVELSDSNGAVVMSLDAARGATFFGGTALVDETTKRAYTVIARGGTCAVLSLGSAQFNRFAEEYRAGASIVQSFMRRETLGRMLVSTLVRAGIVESGRLSTLPSQQLSLYFIELGEHVEARHVSPGELLRGAGSAATSLCFVYQGRLVQSSAPPAAKDASFTYAQRRSSASSAMSAEATEAAHAKRDDRTWSPFDAVSRMMSVGDGSAAPNGALAAPNGSAALTTVADRAVSQTAAAAAAAAAAAQQQQQQQHGSAQVYDTGSVSGEDGMLAGRVSSAVLWAEGPSMILLVDAGGLAPLLKQLPDLRAELQARLVRKLPLDAIYRHPAMSRALLSFHEAVSTPPHSPPHAAARRCIPPPHSTALHRTPPHSAALTAQSRLRDACAGVLDRIVAFHD